MFGHHDDNDQPAEEHQETVEPQDQSSEPDQNVQGAPPADDQSAPPSDAVQNDTPASSSDGSAPADGWQPPETVQTNDKPINDVISPAGGFPKRPTYQYPQGSPPAPDTESSAPVDAAPDINPELIDIRDHALEELEPLLDKLNLPPEDKFRAIMMILQAKDDQSLVKMAYETAHAIEDDEVRARALYDIVNEVNYFTQPPEAQE